MLKANETDMTVCNIHLSDMRPFLAISLNDDKYDERRFGCSARFVYLLSTSALHLPEFASFGHLVFGSVSTYETNAQVPRQ